MHISVNAILRYYESICIFMLMQYLLAMTVYVYLC